MKYFFLFIFFIFHFSTVAQKYFFQSFSTPEGLSQSQVSTICQDSFGYLWIGTFGGISKYNGNTFFNYSTDNGLLNNRINILKWINNQLFIGHQGGISIFENEKIKSFPLKKELRTVNVTDIVSYQNRIIVATNGNGLYEYTNNQLIEIPILKDEFLFTRKLLVHNEELFIATRGGIAKTKNLKATKQIPIFEDVSISSLAIRNNLLIVACYYEGLHFYDLNKNKIIQSAFEDDNIIFNHILIDSKNNIWLSSSEGMIQYNEKKINFINHSVGLPINYISTSFEDQDHSIWIGSQGKGIIKIPQTNINYFDKSTGLFSELILSGFQTKDKQYFLGTLEGGVIKTNDFKTFTNIASIPTVWCAINDIDEKHWFGTKSGLFSINKQNQLTNYDSIKTLPGYKITTFYRIDNLSMYIGGSEGITKYSNGKFSTIGKNNKEIGTVRNITLFNKTLYVATDLGLYYLNKQNTFVPINQINKTVYSIVTTSTSQFFFGTEDGLYELLPNNKIKRIKYSNDVASNYINFITNYKNELFVGTNNGVFVINIHNPNHYSYKITQSNGLIDPETNLNSGFIDHQENLWFGTASGLVKLDIKSINRNTQKSDIQLLNILLNYESFDYSKYGAKIKDGIPQNMSFPYNKNNLQFNFDAISINNFNSMYFQYKINGLDNQWMPPTKSSSLTLTGLAPGEYQLFMRIVFEDGNTLEKIAISFTIKQAFYKTWWFLFFLLSCISALVYVWVRLRIQRLQVKNELEKTEFKARLTSLEQQSLNASMNRHFIFNSLNSIQYFINISDKLSANKFLTNFAKLIRKNLDSSTEENGMVTLAEELERIELYLTLESMRFKDKFEFQINKNFINTENILIPAMMIQPFVENSIIHGILPQQEKKGKIKIEITKKLNHIQISISDYGIGIEKSIEQKKEISGDHKSKGMEITLKRIDLIKKISDEKIEIIGPQQLQNEDGNIKGTLVIINIFLKNLEI